MRPWVKPKLQVGYLYLALIVLLGGQIIITTTATTAKYTLYDQQVQAAELMLASSQILWEAKEARNILPSPGLDPNQTGLIGEEFTTITTSQGLLEAKRTSTNPAFAALLVRFFHEAGLEAGQVVAIGASGSFPALILATLSACQVLDLEPLLIYSLGSSMYGANQPEFTFGSMLEVLREKQLFSYDLLAISLGGDNDRAENLLFPEAQEQMITIASTSGAEFIWPKTLEESIKIRQDLYQLVAGKKQIGAFVNIGGASANFGTTNASLEFSNGLTKNLPFTIDHPERGLIFDFAEAGVPVIHLLNIKDLALKSGINIDPIPFLPLGEEAVYYQVKHQAWLIYLVLSISLAIVFGGRTAFINKFNKF